VQLRRNRSYTLAADNEVRAYVSALVDFSRTSPTTRVFVSTASRRGSIMGHGGDFTFSVRPSQPALYSIDDKEAAPALQRDDAALLKWNPYRHTLAVIRGTMQNGWLQPGGWLPLDRAPCPHSARLSDSARDFELS